MSVLSGRHGYGGKMIKVKYSALIELECEVTNWAEMPKYKGRDNENG